MVWDLDNTLWTGTISEGDRPVLNQAIVEAILYLDARGVLHSIASRNSHEHAMAMLREFGLEDYFLYPQIHWDSKDKSIRDIAQQLNIGLDSLCFVDDQQFEREQVKSACDVVLCLSPEDFLSSYREMHFPQAVTPTSASRRLMYSTESVRRRDEENFNGTSSEFLRQLNLRLVIQRLQDQDLKRAEELSDRTHQLNTTGYTYSEAQLKEMAQSGDFIVLTASLSDKYGDYGIVGLSVIENHPGYKNIKLFLLSCRVMSRGIAGAFLQFILDIARKENVALRAEYVPNGRNRQMLMTYKFAGFDTLNDIEKDETGRLTLEHGKDRMLLAMDHVSLEECVV